MDLFGKKAVSSLQGRVDEVERQLRQAMEARDHSARALEKQTRALEAAREEVEDLKRRLEAAEAQAARSREALAQAEKMVAWVSEKEAKSRAESETAQRERDDAVRRAEGLSAEVRELRAALDEARRAAREKAETPAGPARPPRTQPVPAEDVERLRKENMELRKTLAEQGERLKVALRKAEHNRRAWLVTQMQLDLAEDRLHLLTHGKPRPVLGVRDAPVGTAPGERVQAEDVEGMEEIGEAEGPSPPVPSPDRDGAGEREA